MAVLTTLLEALPERTRYPEKRMNTEEGKSSQQQPCHGPESVIQVGIFVPVMVGCMGQIAGKFPVGPRMAFLAGLYNMPPVQVGFAVIGWQNVMGPVTVRALGCLLTTGKHGSLAMICLEIGICFMFMTGAAFIKDQAPESGGIVPADRMRGVAIIADRQFFICLGYRGTMDGRAEFFSNTKVALGTSLYDVVPVYA